VREEEKDLEEQSIKVFEKEVEINEYLENLEKMELEMKMENNAYIQETINLKQKKMEI